MTRITAETTPLFLQHLPILRTFRLQDHNQVSAIPRRCTPISIKHSNQKDFCGMAYARDVGAQPDWHGQDCFMGIGDLSQIHA